MTRYRDQKGLADRLCRLSGAIRRGRGFFGAWREIGPGVSAWGQVGGPAQTPDGSLMSGRRDSAFRGRSGEPSLDTV
jgi:hypothetical protein